MNLSSQPNPGDQPSPGVLNAGGLNPSDPEELLNRHCEWLKTIANYLCVGCNRPRERKTLRIIGLWFPAKEYKKSGVTSYSLCNECEKLTKKEIYDRVEAWGVERGYFEL